MTFSRVLSPLSLFLLLLAPACLRADHPDAERLLPEKTLVFVKIENMQEFIKGMSEVSVMKMVRDEKLAPIVESLYGSVEEAYQTVEDQLGVSLDQLQNLVQGEVTFALIADKEEGIQVAMFVDYSGNKETVDTLLKFGEDRALENEAKIETETVGEIEIRTIQSDEDFHYFQKTDSICVTNNLDLSKLILARWTLDVGEELNEEFKEEVAEGLEKRTFHKNRKYLNIMKQCEGDEDNPPQAKFYVDPFELIRSTQSGVAATATLGILRGLGVDGLLGIGGSATMIHSEFESVFHLHVGLANPRSGLIKMMAMEPGDLTPEPLFPSGTATYFTTNWNVDTTFNEIEKLYDLFNGEGALAEELEENFTEELGLDLKEDILGAMEGRISFAQYMVDPGSLNGMSVMLTAKLKDAKEFEDVFLDLQDSIVELAGDQDNDEKIFTSMKYRGVEYFKLPEPPTQEERQRRREERQARLREQRGEDAPEARERRVQFGLRNPTPCVGIIGDYFVFTDSEDMMKEAIKNEKNPDDILAEDPDYKKLMREINRQLDGKKPALILFSRPSESIRMLYEAIKNDQTKDAISDLSENPFFDAMKKAFVDNELPEFEHLEKYFSPEAGVMTNDETGFHMMSFSQKVDIEDEEEDEKDDDK